MPTDASFTHHCCELFAPTLGRCQAKRMFGGFGISADGMTFAIVADLGGRKACHGPHSPPRGVDLPDRDFGQRNQFARQERDGFGRFADLQVPADLPPDGQHNVIERSHSGPVEAITYNG